MSTGYDNLFLILYDNRKLFPSRVHPRISYLFRALSCFVVLRWFLINSRIVLVVLPEWQWINHPDKYFLITHITPVKLNILPTPDKAHRNYINMSWVILNMIGEWLDNVYHWIGTVARFVFLLNRSFLEHVVYYGDAPVVYEIWILLSSLTWRWQSTKAMKNVMP